MRIRIVLYLILTISITLNAQLNRINYNNQQLFLSGANLAWVNFANDIGPGETDFESFASIMLEMHDYGGNALRWWLHTNGTNTPQFNSSNVVIGPGSGTISDLKQILDLAWQREIGIKLCLWSFDMLRSSNGNTVLNRNKLLLQDTSYTMAYINNCLIPIVDSLKGHPAIIAWEIFNEPEGMSNEFGWSDIQHVPMSAIQRFINLCAGAIHRTDTTALVTNGSWSFQALTDVQLLRKYNEFKDLSNYEKFYQTEEFNRKHNLNLSVDEFSEYIDKISVLANYNYYRDDRLIAAGGDLEGTLDFYSVHYYVGLGSSYSPFTHTASYWGLDKPILIAEFAMSQNNGVPKNELFKRLYQTGYAGSLPWSWTDTAFSTHADMLAGMQYMWDNYRSDVDVLGISGEWPLITIVSPDTNAVFPEGATVEIVADATDNDGEIVLVEFFINSGTKIGERDTLPFTFQWTNIQPNTYSIYAVATDNTGNKRISNRVPITVGTPPMTKLEAEFANRQGTGMTIKSDQQASNGLFVDIATQVGTITWTLPNVPQAGDYEIAFRAKLFYNTPKEQFINVNGVRADTIRFEGGASSWIEKGTTIHLNQGANTIQMELYWGWMYLDYLAVPSTITGVEDDFEINYTEQFILYQNYPNPFNPITTIKFALPVKTNLTLSVYNTLGEKVAEIFKGEMEEGYHEMMFNASGLSSGVYFYKIESENFNSTRKLMLLK